MDNRFPENWPYTVHDLTVRTGHGTHRVRYRYYERIPYCALPVSRDYQTMNIKVPFAVDGRPVDSKNAPILLNILVGGYFAVKNTEDTPVKDSPFTEDGGRKGGRPEPYVKALDDKDEIALAAGFVVVTPGVRGWNCVDDAGRMFGNAPSVIVDYKAAVRYLRFNRDRMWGDTEHILSTGGSAGGAVSALIGATGNDHRFEPYLEAIGAPKERDDIFMAACFSPITNLEHADGAYEWEFGALARKIPLQMGPTRLEPSDDPEDQTLSRTLQNGFRDYLATEGIRDAKGEELTPENLGAVLCDAVLYASATRFLNGLEVGERETYLRKNPWICWQGENASFSFKDYVNHCGRMKPLPAFDALEMGTPENNVFGTETVRGRHFTEFSLRLQTGDPKAELEPDLKAVRTLMNPMNFTDGEGCCQHWWICHGSSDPHTSLAIPMLLAMKLENSGKEVELRSPWDGWHRADDDPQGLIDRMCSLSGYLPAWLGE